MEIQALLGEGLRWMVRGLEFCLEAMIRIWIACRDRGLIKRKRDVWVG